MNTPTVPAFDPQKLFSDVSRETDYDALVNAFGKAYHVAECAAHVQHPDSETIDGAMMGPYNGLRDHLDAYCDRKIVAALLAVADPGKAQQAVAALRLDPGPEADAGHAPTA